jgi:hypothetical protein
MYSIDTTFAAPKNPKNIMKELAEICFRKNPYPALRTVSCDFHHGVLILRGCLPTYYLKQLAQEAVAHLNGVDRIENLIQVVRPN